MYIYLRLFTKFPKPFSYLIFALGDVVNSLLIKIFLSKDNSKCKHLDFEKFKIAGLGIKTLIVTQND